MQTVGGEVNIEEELWRSLRDGCDRVAGVTERVERVESVGIDQRPAAVVGAGIAPYLSALAAESDRDYPVRCDALLDRVLAGSALRVDAWRLSLVIIGLSPRQWVAEFDVNIGCGGTA